MAKFLVPDKTEVWNGVKVNKYFITDHNVNKISMPTTPMPDNKKSGTTIHNTDVIDIAAGTTYAEQYLRSTINGNMGSVRVHFYVDYQCIWWCLPLDLSSWHAADGSGPGNLTTISIECVMGKNYDANDRKAEDNAARLIAYLMDKYNWDINNLYTHTHWLAVKSGRKGSREYLNETKLKGQKWCPAYILPHFSDFEKLVEKYRTGKPSVVEPTTPTNPTKPTTPSTSTAYKTGDLVSIKSGAVYTSGAKVPSWVLNTRWYLSSVSGSRAILGKSEDGKSNIQSPIDTKYLVKVNVNNTPSTSNEIKDVADFTVNLKKDTVIYKNPDGVTKSGSIGQNGVFTITHTCNGYGRLKSGAGWVKLDTTNNEPIKAGDTVKVLKNEQYNGKTFKVYESKYTVLSVSGDRAVISADGKNVTAAVNVKNIEKC